MGAAQEVTLVAADGFAWLGLRAALSSTPAVRLVDQGIAREPALVFTSVPDDAEAVARWLTRLAERWPNARFVVVAEDLSPAQFAGLGRFTLAGCLLWRDLTPDLLETCLSAMFAGVFVASPLLGAELLAGPGRAASSIRGLLTSRQLEVLALLTHGATDEEVAQQLVITVSAVQSHVENMKSRLGVTTRLQLGYMAGDADLEAG